MRSQSHSLDVQTLTTPHIYKPETGPKELGVWSRFNDPQLNQLISVALADSPTIAIARDRVRRAEYLAAGAEAALWPTIDLSGYIQRQRFSATGLVPPPFNGNTYNIAELGLNFNYEFDFWGKNRETYQAAFGEVFATRADANQARLILSSAVANTYFQLLGSLEQAKLVEENWRLNQRLIRIAKDRTQHGVESALPLKIIEVNAQQSKLALAQIRQNEAVARHQLAALLGKNPSVTDIVTLPLKYHAHPITLREPLPANLLAQRPDIAATKFRAEAAAHQINAAKARFFPDINLNLLFSYQNVGLTQFLKPANQNNAVTGAFDLPIFDAGARRANLGVKLSEYDQAVDQYNQTILTALNEVADQLSILKALDSQLNAQNSSVKASYERYGLTQSQFHHGITDQATLLNNRVSLIQQEAIQQFLQTRRLQAVVGMLKALGGSDVMMQEKS